MSEENRQPSPEAAAQIAAEQLRLDNILPRTRRLQQAMELRQQLLEHLQQGYPHTPDEQHQLATTTYALVDTLLTEILDWQRLALTLAHRVPQVLDLFYPGQLPPTLSLALGVNIGNIMGRANREATAFTQEEAIGLYETWPFTNRLSRP